MLGVGEQRERELVLVPELDVGGLVVGADPEDDGSALLELGVFVPDVARLLRAARRVVLRIEVENDRVARKWESRTRSPESDVSVK